MHAADLILVHATVRTLDGDRVAEAVAVERGRIVGVGSTADVEDLRGPSTEVIDATGGTLLPSFIDSHTHFHRAAILRALFVDFDEEPAASIADVVSVIRARASALPDAAWIQGDQLRDYRLAERRWPVRQELDAAVPDRPVVIRSLGKHLVIANSRALQIAGIDRTTQDPVGGKIDRDEHGEPTGVLHETGKLRLDSARPDSVVPRPSEEERLGALRKGIALVQSKGVTNLHEIVAEPEAMSDFLLLRERGELGVRLRFYVRAVEAKTKLEYLTGLGIRSGLGDDWLRISGIKISVDGSCESRNAAVYDPYPGQPDNRGLVRVAQDELDHLFDEANRGGIQIAVHAIGPRAADMALTSFARALAAFPRTDHRHRLEHAYLPVRPGTYEKARSLQLIMSEQPGLVYSSGDAYHQMFGADGVIGIMPLRTLLDMGLPVQANSDFPSTPMDPFIGLKAAVTRRTRNGMVVDPGQAITRDEALRMLIKTAAFTTREEHDAGTIEVGKRADLVLLDRDPLSTPPDELDRIQVRATVLDGRIVHRDATL